MHPVSFIYSSIAFCEELMVGDREGERERERERGRFGYLNFEFFLKMKKGESKGNTQESNSLIMFRYNLIHNVKNSVYVS